MAPSSGRRVALVTLGCAPQRGRLRGAGRAARRRRLGAGARGRRRRRRGRQHLRLRRRREEGLDRHAARRGGPQDPGSRTQAVVAVGCLAERYGDQLAASLPEADAVLSFDDYADISGRLQSILAGEAHVPHVPRDRRTLLPLAPADRAAARPAVHGRRHLPAGPARGDRAGRRPAPGPDAAGRRPDRRRSSWPPAATAAAPSARSPRSAVRSCPAGRRSCWPRRAWLAEQGVRELVLVSENSTSYGKDLGDLRLLETLLPELAAVAGRRPGPGELPAARRDAARAGRPP